MVRGTTGVRPPRLPLPLPPSSPPRASTPPLDFPSSDEEEIVPTSDDIEIEELKSPHSTPALYSMHERHLRQLTDPAGKAECERLWNALPRPLSAGDLAAHWFQVNELMKASASRSSPNVSRSPGIAKLIPTSSSTMRQGHRESKSVQRKEKRREGVNQSTRVLRSQKTKKVTQL